METTDKRKEDLLKKFEEFIDDHDTLVFQHHFEMIEVFGFFWKEIEAVRNTYNALDKAHQTASDQIQELRKQLKAQHEIIEAADEVINNMKAPVNTIDLIRYSDARDKYNQLKSNQQSPNS